uniref:RabBD domain-containing protein n=1 Tax=Piliocolobus tephrosceles TaxID=591936 RepID=A0A8C9H4P6_9PRIM
MTDTIFGSGSDQWVCPNDRQLALRAKLQTGWSVHTYQTEKQRRNQHLSPEEVEAILQVIQRAERLDVLEQQRIGRLVERLETMRRNVMGNGLSQCLLCGEVLGFLGSASVFCKDCRKVRPCSGPAVPASQPGPAPVLCGFASWLPGVCVSATHLFGRQKCVSSHPQAVVPALAPPPVPAGRGWSSDLLCCGLSLPVVSSDSDSDSDLSSSSLEDRLPPAGVRGPKGDKPWRESGGTVETPRMGLMHPLGHLSGSQSSLASEMGTDSADPHGGPLPQADPRGRGKRHTWTSPQC